VPAVLLLRLLHHVGHENNLDLLDVVAVEKQLRGAKEGLTPVDLDERSARLGAMSRRGGGQEQDAELSCHADISG
jgi:hypothetical protein